MHQSSTGNTGSLFAELQTTITQLIRDDNESIRQRMR